MEDNDIQEEYGDLCTAPLLMGRHALRFLAASNIFLAVTATLGNAVILAALHKESSLHPPSKIFLRSLAITDFCTGILVEPCFVAFLLSLEHESWNICFSVLMIIIVVAYLLFSVSLLTLTAISVDRLLALLLGMRYRQVVTLKRGATIIMCIWALSFAFTTIWYFNGMITLYYSSINALLCLVISTCCYLKIYQKLLRHQAQIHQGQPNGFMPLNMARYRKTVSSALWIQLALVGCYIPSAVVLASLAIRGPSPFLFVAWTLTSTLVLLNSTLNPILYCWKIREIRRVVIGTIRQLSCC